MALFERMLIAGVGLIGGSLGLAARGRRLVNETVGYGRGEENLKIARERGAIDRYSRSAQEAARGADLIVLAVPVRSLRAVAEQLLPHAAPDALVIDVGNAWQGVVVGARLSQGNRRDQIRIAGPIVDNRCAIMMIVRCSRSASNVVWIHCSEMLSSALVAS